MGETQEIILYNNNLAKIHTLQAEEHNLLYNTPSKIRAVIKTNDTRLIRRRCVINQNLKIINEKRKLNDIHSNLLKLCSSVEDIKTQILNINYSVTDCKDVSNIVRNYNITKTLKSRLNDLTSQILHEYNLYVSQSAALNNATYVSEYNEFDRVKMVADRIQQISESIRELEETNTQLDIIIQLKSKEAELEAIKMRELEHIALEEERLKLENMAKEKEIKNQLLEIENEKEKRRQIKMKKRMQK